MGECGKEQFLWRSESVGEGCNWEGKKRAMAMEGKSQSTR